MLTRKCRIFSSPESLANEKLSQQRGNLGKQPRLRSSLQWSGTVDRNIKVREVVRLLGGDWATQVEAELLQHVGEGGFEAKETSGNDADEQLGTGVGVEGEAKVDEALVGISPVGVDDHLHDGKGTGEQTERHEQADEDLLPQRAAELHQEGDWENGENYISHNGVAGFHIVEHQIDLPARVHRGLCALNRGEGPEEDPLRD